MMWRNRYGGRNMMWPAHGMRNDRRGLRGARWDMDFLLGGTSGPVQSNFPAMNVWQGDEGVVVTAEIPGVLPENIEITVSGDILTVSGNRDDEQLPENARYNRRERGHGEFSRKLKLQYHVDSESVVATFTNGILQIELPRLPEEKPRKIEVKSA
jgi:HSP20 family protein